MRITQKYLLKAWNILQICWLQKTISPTQRIRRKQAIATALDATLLELLITQSPASKHPENNQKELTDFTLQQQAEMAVKANETHCGPVAHTVLRHLDTEINHVVFCSLKGHYVVKDLLTGLLYDLECYSGCLLKTDLPFAKRVPNSGAGWLNENVLTTWKQQYLQSQKTR